MNEALKDIKPRILTPEHLPKIEQNMNNIYCISTTKQPEVKKSVSIINKLLKKQKEKNTQHAFTILSIPTNTDFPYYTIKCKSTATKSAIQKAKSIHSNATIFYEAPLNINTINIYKKLRAMRSSRRVATTLAASWVRRN